MANEDKTHKQPMEFYNMSDFLKGQSSKLITGLSEDDKTAFVLKLLPTWAKIGTLGVGATVIFALGTWDIF